jgi:hypothetical protein
LFRLRHQFKERGEARSGQCVHGACGKG